LKAIVLASTLAFSIVSSAQASEQLMEKSGCISCHRIDQKLVGPAFKDVAAKYKSRPDAAAYLFGKVRSGSEDVWGDMPMPPKSSEQLSDADLNSIIDWLLKL
jgi:cytochrome c